VRPLAQILVLALNGLFLYALFAPTEASTSAVSFQSSRDCRACHEEVYAEWQDSQHAFSFENPAVRALSNDFANKNCIDCHAPKPVFESGIGERVLPRTTRQIEGVDCISCHAIPSEQGGGVAGTITDRGAACQPVQRVELQRPVLCAGCHDQHQTMQQWEGSSWAEKRVTCIDCHMPFREGDPNLGRDHRCLGGNDLEMIQGAVELSARRVDSGVEVSVANVGAGHSFPTDERSRAADVFWRPVVAGEPGPWQHVYRFRSPYRDETHLPDTLLLVDSTWTQTIEGAEPPLEVALFYKRSPYWADPENPDPESEADYLVHRLSLEP